MPKNTTGGSGHKRRKNNDTTVKSAKKAEDLQKNVDKAAHEYYAVVEKPLGGRRFKVQCQAVDNTAEVQDLTVKLAGACRMKISPGTFVLVQRFPFNLNQGGIVQVYADDDVQTLKFAKIWDFPEKKIRANFREQEVSFRVEDQDRDEDEDSDDDDPFRQDALLKYGTGKTGISGKAAARDAQIDWDAEAI